MEKELAKSSDDGKEKTESTFEQTEAKNEEGIGEKDADAEVKADGKINKSIANESLKALGIDKFGLDGMDRTILSTLIEKFEGGPVGVNSLSVAVSEDASTIEDVYEPYLIKQGFIQRTNRGRIAQEKAYKLFNKTITNKQQGLFK